MEAQAIAMTGGSGWRKPLWILALVAASIAFTLGFACATPLPAFAAMAAITLGRRDALLLAGGVWLANQIVGYGLLAYPVTADSIAWGVLMGAATILAALAARPAVRLGAIGGPIAAFALAFAVYEILLFIPAATVLGGVEEFAPAVVVLIFKINAAAMGGLWAIDRLGRAAGLAPRQAPRLA